MKVAVTGASGFIGRHVVLMLARDGHSVTASSRTPIADLPARVGHAAIGISDPAGALACLGNPDVVVHLAWSGLPNYRSLHHFETELPAQYRFLRSLIDDGLTRLVVAGTCYEYGMQNGELDETMDCRPSNPYAHAKLALCRQLQFLQEERPFALTWARLFYTYGEGQAPSSIWSQLSAAIARGDTRFPMSAGDQLRDFLPVADVAGYLSALATNDGNGGIVNICSGRPTSIRALVERWLAENEWAIELDLGRYPYPGHEPLAFWGSTARLRQLLGEVHG